MLRCLVISARVLNELVSVNARQWSGVNGGGEGGAVFFFSPQGNRLKGGQLESSEQRTQMAAALMGRTVAANNCGY